MTSLPELEFNYRQFLDKTTILYGESGTGKSYAIIDILYALRPYADQIIVISPMDKTNHTYSNGIVPLPCIHYTITSELLDDVWERQNAFGSVYTKANNPVILKQLFEKIPNNRTARSVIEDISNKCKIRSEEILDEGLEEGAAQAKVSEMKKECERLLIMIHKHYINENWSILQKIPLSRDEVFSLKFINFNPRLVFVFDDCTSVFRKFIRHPVIQNLFYQGRWAYITAIIACHTDKMLDPELKKGAFINIFTEESCAHAYFERKTNDLNKEAKTRASAACKAAFTPLAMRQKLVWVREDRKFYRFTASPHEDFHFGSATFREYCKQVRADAGSMQSNNKFIQNFQ